MAGPEALGQGVLAAPSALARLSFALRQAGLLASPVTTPAVPFWASRVRVNLSADYSQADIERLDKLDCLCCGILSDCLREGMAHPGLMASKVTQ